MIRVMRLVNWTILILQSSNQQLKRVIWLFNLLFDGLHFVIHLGFHRVKSLLHLLHLILGFGMLVPVLFDVFDNYFEHARPLIVGLSVCVLVNEPVKVLAINLGKLLRFSANITHQVKDVWKLNKVINFHIVGYGDPRNLIFCKSLSNHRNQKFHVNNYKQEWIAHVYN